MNLSYQIKHTEAMRGTMQKITINFLEFIAPGDRVHNANEHLLELAKRRAFHLGANHYDWVTKKFTFITKDTDKLVDRIEEKMESVFKIAEEKSERVSLNLVTKGSLR